MPTERCSALRGRVFMSRMRCNFYARGEHSVQLRQQPQIFPRTNWPHEPNGPPSSRPLKRYHDEDDYHTIHQGYSVHTLSPMLPFLTDTNDPNPTYRTSTWLRHVAILHGFLFDTLPHKGWMECVQLDEFLAMVSYGMNDYMTWLPHPFVIYGRPTRDHPTAFPVTYHSGLGTAVASGEFISQNPADVWSATRFKKHMQGRRFIVVPVNEYQMHWLMTIFDREHGHLYIFDAVRRGRKQRIRATAQLWAQFWHHLGMPWHFTYFAPETSEQIGAYECGYLAIQWVVNMLRANMGKPTARKDNSIRTDDLWIGTCKTLHPYLEDIYPMATSSIPVCDWLPSESCTTREATRAVMDLMELMVVNELGLWKSDCLNGKSAPSRQLRKLMFQEAPKWQWPSALTPLELRIPSDQLQFIRSERSHPSDHPGDTLTGGAPIRVCLCPRRLSHTNDTQPVKWPRVECTRYDPRRSLRTNHPEWGFKLDHNQKGLKQLQ